MELKENPGVFVLRVLWFLVQIIYYFLESVFRKIVPVAQKDIKGKVVVLTGAGAGIGRELAIRLAKKGATLALWDVHKDSVAETALMVREFGVQAKVYICDVSNRQAVLDTARTVQRDLGQVDILFNNAGILIGGSILELSEKEIRKTIDVNTIAHFWTLQAFLPSMIERNDGHVVTIASIAGKLGAANLSAYCTSKWAAFGLTESLKAEMTAFKKTGVKATTICPTFVGTPMIHNQARFRPAYRVGEILQISDVADAIMNGFLRNHDVVYIPKYLANVPVIQESWPKKSQEALTDLIGLRFTDPATENN